MSLLAEPPKPATFPPFEPHPLLSNGHLQTIVARYWPVPRIKLPSTYHEVELGHGARLSVLQSIPDSWRPGDPAVVMVHGLAGCVRSPYLSRVGLRLYRMGLRVIRMNMRGAGSGYGISKNFYHGGRSEDPRAVVGWLAHLAPGSPIGLVGFSLGANLVLKLAAEAADDPIEGFDCVVAANPPLDLQACCIHIRRPQGKIYDWNFIQLLKAEERKLRVAFPELPPVDFSGVRNLFEFDNAYTAPRNGFRDADEYYARSSSAPLIPRIKAPGLVIHAADDPFIPVEPLLRVEFPKQLALELNPHGGHLGYLSRRSGDGDRRWLDARIASWLASRWGVERIGEGAGRAERSPQGGRNVNVRHQLQ
jgi:predicted alpha/beta-fold hydrolase